MSKAIGIASGETRPAKPAFPAAVELGELSRVYETGGRGPGTVSGGRGDAGGISYGSYQMTSRPGGGTVIRFISEPDFPWKARFRKFVPATPGFTRAWQALAAEFPAAFFKAQHRFIERTHFAPLALRVRQAHGLDLSSRSRALQDAVWSTAVQHGPGTPVLDRALAAMPALATTDPGFDRALIQRIYAERGRRNADGTLAYFSKNSMAVQIGVARRFLAELRDALRMLEGEKAAARRVPAE